MKKNKKELVGLLLILVSILLFISIIWYDITEQPGGLDKGEVINSILGYFGIYTSYYQFLLLGYLSISIPILMFVSGLIIFTRKSFKNYYKYFIIIVFVTLWLSLFFAFLGYFNISGITGMSLNIFLKDIFGRIGVISILFLSFIVFNSIIFRFSIYETLKNILFYFFKKIKQFYSNTFSSYSNYIKNKKTENRNDKTIDNIAINKEDIEISKNDENKKVEQIVDDNKDDELIEEDILDLSENNNDEVKSDVEEVENKELIIEEEDNIEKGKINENKNRSIIYKSYKLPLLDYLTNPIEINTHNEDELKEKAEQLDYALNSFGVSGKIRKISPGPIITLFEIEPSEGVRVSKFTNLSEDLSRIMGGKRVRIIAPIPGSKSVGVEIPNTKPSMVYMKTILNSKKYSDNISKLKIALGKTTTGDAFVFELNKMPHLLVAGATGAGKSVCINTIIVSLLYNAKPDEVKFILMDPKKVELSTYKTLIGYHLISAPNLDEYVMTTSENSVSILNSAIDEMERRFQIFSDVRVRNIDEYNKKQKSDNNLEKIPYLVVIIDELADLMMTSGRAIEEPITRLAQKARAVGLHLIVATQRPSVDVITGLIKSNFPARIAFQVSSKIDSRTIIDQIGAEKLLGRGDMLFLLPGTAAPIRLHNAFIELTEIENIMEHISSQPKPPLEIKLPEIKKNESNNEFDISGDQDEYLKDAAKLVIDHQQASVSLLQRKFRIGYSRAGRLIDELESLGIISGYSGSKARDVLVDYSYLDELFNDSN